MALVLALLLLALVFGGFGIAVAGLKWLLIIGIVLLVASVFTGWRGYGSHHH
jgi:hypothetical protein